MLVFMVGSSGVLVFLSGDHARFMPVPQRGQKIPRKAGLSLKKGGRSMRANPSPPQEQQPDNPAHPREHCVSIGVVQTLPLCASAWDQSATLGLCQRSAHDRTPLKLT
jgi:hypothetical protein